MMTDERLDQIYLEVVGPKGGPLSRAYGRAVLAAQPQPEVPVPAPPFDPAVEPPWHRSDMGPAQPEAKDDVAYCQWCDRPVSEHAVIGKCEFVKGRKLPQPEAISQTVPDNDCVICPKCAHQFRAISVNDQKARKCVRCDEHATLCTPCAHAMYAAQPQPEAAALTDKQIALEIEAAMRRSFSMGQTYCAQADSDSWKQNKKSFETLAKFNSYIEEVRAVLAAKGKP